MADRGVNTGAASRVVSSMRVVRRVVFAVASVGAIGCGESTTQPQTPSASVDTKPPKPPEFERGEGRWGRFASKRFQLSVPLPDGRSWKVDDHSRPYLYAVHEPTSSKLQLVATQEDELVNRRKCEVRARELGWVPPNLTTVDEEVTVGPDAYDSRIWVALDARPDGSMEGHVFLFGAFVRRCLLVHLRTAVASARDEDVLSSRLAVARARILRGITLDPPRTSDDAEVPKVKPDIRR